MQNMNNKVREILENTPKDYLLATAKLHLPSYKDMYDAEELLEYIGYATWEEYKGAGLDAADLTGVYGNIKTFGPEWASLTQEQRQAVTQGIIDAGLYESNKGEVEIIKDEMIEISKFELIELLKQNEELKADILILKGGVISVMDLMGLIDKETNLIKAAIESGEESFNRGI